MAAIVGHELFSCSSEKKKKEAASSMEPNIRVP